MTSFSIPGSTVFVRGYSDPVTFSLTMANTDANILIEAVSGAHENFNFTLYMCDADVRVDIASDQLDVDTVITASMLTI